MIFLLIFIFVSFFFPNIITFFIPNIPNFTCWGIHDLYLYFKHKEYNRCKEWGMIRLNCSDGQQVFGCGKTLLLVMRARYIYKRYNDKFVFNKDKGIFVKQKIRIISNVELYDVPYIKFSDVNQLIDIDKFGFGSEDVTIYLLDESGAIFNSRNYRNNISTDFLTRLLQSRKNKVALYMTSQRFEFTDKILREVCHTVTTCHKYWRIVKHTDYNANELENAVNPKLVKPKQVSYTFCKDSDYHSYNSYQLVEELRKDYKPDMYLDTKEILDTYGSTGSLDQLPERRLTSFRSKKRKSS